MQKLSHCCFVLEGVLPPQNLHLKRTQEDNPARRQSELGRRSHAQLDRGPKVRDQVAGASKRAFRPKKLQTWVILSLTT